MSNHDATSDSYEDLFDDDIGKDHPCYLPDKTQDYEPLSSQDYKLPVAIKKTSNRHSAGEIDCEENEGTSCSNGAFIPEEGLVESASAEDTVARKFSSRNGEASAGNGFSQGLKEGDHIQESEISSSPSSCGGGLSSSGGGTSGYVVGSGSSSAASLCSVRGVEEIRDFVQREDRDIDDTDINKVGWTPGKQHADEDDTYSSWRKRKKHFFILSHAGKPIYSRYGDEHKLAGFSATLQAIMSFVENSGDRIRLVRAGDHQIVFMVKGPIYLVSICATEEPAQSLRRQLELLHGQLLLILTKSVEKCFVKNAKFDMKPLLGGTEMVFSSLIHAFSWNFATFLHSYTCLPLPYTTRQATGAALQDVADTDVLFALLLCGSKVISLVGSQKASLHPDDILLLANFVSSSESFRTTESFSPVCLPRYNANVFLYAYVQYLNTDICLIFLTTSADGFFHLKECRSRVEGVLTESRVLLDIGHSVLKGGLRVEDLPGDSVSDVYHRSNNSHGVSISAEGSRRKVVGVGGAAGLWHFIYRNINLDQYVASEYSPCLHTRYAQKRLFRAYQRLFTSMHNGVVGTHKMQYQRDEDHVLLSWCTQDFELFAAFDPLAEKSSAITVCNRICQWLRDLESEIFLIGASPFSW